MRKIRNKYTLKEFHKFLKTENILEKYIKHFTKRKSINWRIGYEQKTTFEEYFKERMEKKIPNLIRFAFEWEDTEDGHCFWEDMNDKWEKKYQEIRKDVFNNYD